MNGGIGIQKLDDFGQGSVRVFLYQIDVIDEVVILEGSTSNPRSFYLH